MGRELGRISGPLLADNLLRKGHNLAFETNLLYFDVVNNRIGINFGSPTTDLFVNGTTNTAYANINQQAELANFTVFNNTIQNSHSTITIQPNQASDPTTVVPTLGTDNLNFNTNYIQNILASDSINITSTGTIKLNANTLVSGSLEVTGNITFDGNITLGDSNTDTVTFGAEINSNIEPSITDIYDLGSSANKWLRLYTNTATTTLAQTTNLSNNNLTVGSLLIQNNTIYNTTLAQTVQFKPNGTGVVNLDNFVNVNTNTITNTSNGALIFASTSIPTATAFWRFNSASAMAIPVNDATNYTPEQGTIRFNPTTGDAEAYSTSNGWLNFIGPASAIANQNQSQDESLVFTLMLGF